MIMLSSSLNDDYISLKHIIVTHKDSPFNFWLLLVTFITTYMDVIEVANTFKCSHVVLSI